MSKLWGGRFEKETDRDVEAYTASIGVDERLWSVDIQGSVAHAQMLGKTGILSKEESQTIVGGLESVAKDFSDGKVQLRPEAEDIHSEIERLLTEKIGAVAGKLHTARSRNDQVATDSRLYLRGQTEGMISEIAALQTCLIQIAEKNLETVLPGLTHIQHAQPVSLAHHVMAYFWMLERDRTRLSDSLARVNILPLGSAALAGTSFPIDRGMVAQALGFSAPSQNSLDSVSDRDFVVEFLSAAALVMTHLSQLAQELTLWSSPEFGFVELDDSVTTGSSIMPQKKNPDVAELIRGRSARLIGALTGSLALLKALPLSYNRDLQEDKGFLFEGIDVTRSSLRMARLMLETARFNPENMAFALMGDFSNATDLADYLTKKGLPFRQCHEVTGKIVRTCLERQQSLEDLTLPDLKAFHPLFEADVLRVIPHVAVMRARTSEGGTAPSAVKTQIERAKALH